MQVVQILRHLQARCFPDSETSVDVIPHIALGGWGGWNYVIGTAMLLKDMGDDRIRLYCLLDRDYHSADEIAARQAEGKRHGIELHIWRRKEIENYLVHPKAIHRIIEAAVTSGKAPTLDAVRQQIEALIEELREDTTELIATEIQKRTRNRTSLAASMKEARSTVAEAWKTEEGRLGVVSGKELLAKIAALAKATYNASVSPKRILRELRIDEIPDEMRAVIQAIELTAPLAS